MFKMFVSLLALASSAMAESQQYYENSIPAQTRLNERLLMMQSDKAAAGPVYGGSYYGEPVASQVYLQEQYFGMKPQNIVIMTSLVWLLTFIFLGFGIWYCWSKSLFGLNPKAPSPTTTTITTSM